VALQHKHLLVQGRINQPLTDEREAERWLHWLVQQIDMKVVLSPRAFYVQAVGNRGITASVNIETSHIAFHIWDEQEPPLIQFDLYTCGPLDHEQVIGLLNRKLDFESMQYLVLDREDGFQVTHVKT
jgi:S-adenosylmethionine/arginine decarboxylase-like enzyme